jgi:hypothetical protein
MDKKELNQRFEALAETMSTKVSDKIAENMMYEFEKRVEEHLDSELWQRIMNSKEAK